MRIFLSLVLFIGLATSVGCATLEKAFSEEGVLYQPTARGNYEAGQKALDDENWEEASKYFGHVQSKFPYSKFALLASLRLGDSQFGDEKYLEAIDTYRRFIKLHPRHEQVPYADFRIAEAFAKRMPERWFFLPPVAEKDQTQVLDARRALKNFIARYPDHAKVPEARELLAETEQRLVEHEQFAARFYAREGHWRAVAWRYEAIAERFPDHEDAAESLLDAGAAYEKLGEGKAALRNYQQLMQRYPQSEAAREAQQRIDAGVANPEADQQGPGVVTPPLADSAT